MERSERLLLGVVVALAILTAFAMWALWPEQTQPLMGEPAPLHDGVVRSAEAYDCPQQTTDLVVRPQGPCQKVEVEVVSGPYAGERFRIDTGEEDYPPFTPGDHVRVGVGSVAEGEPSFYVADFARLAPLGGLAIVFLGAVLAVGRWRGARSVVGLLASLGIITAFIVPAILSGRNPFGVAVVGAFAIMLLTLYLSHGLTVKTTAALVGTAAALALTALLGIVFVELTELTGLASEEASLARFSVEALDLRGLVLAGLVIGALGVLDDVTVSQASTVFAVHDANPDQSWREVFRRAMDVGRDHIASTVNTLVLAYVGASIPLLVLFSTGGLGFTEILNAEVVAEEVVKTLVGSVGLVSAVPLTTALATSVALRRQVRKPPPLPAHLDDDAPAEHLSDEELAHRAWIAFLRDGEGAGRPPARPGSDEGG